MRRSTTALILIAALVVVVALVIRSNQGEPAAGDSSAATSTSTSTVETPTSGPIGTSSTTSLPPLPPGTSACDLYDTISVTGAIESPDLVEASGLAVSRTSADVLWSHNDSRGGPILYAFDSTGRDIGEYVIPNALSLDWEDIAAGPDSDGAGAYLYVGDMGDNFGIRDGVISVFRVEDLNPNDMENEFPNSMPIVLQMPDGPHDAEALFIDPVEPALYVVTKSTTEAFVFKGPMTSALEPQQMELVATLFLGAEVSGGDISPDGGLIALRGYNTVWMWTREDGSTVGEAMEAEPCTAPSPEERQGESIGIAADWSYFTVSEGDHPDVHHIAAQR